MSVRPITDTLRHIGGGVFIDQASDKLAGRQRSGRQRQRRRHDHHDRREEGDPRGAMHIGGKITLKKPAEDPMEAMLFATPEGNLIADDPRQQKLDLKRVDGASDAPPAALKTA